MPDSLWPTMAVQPGPAPAVAETVEMRTETMPNAALGPAPATAMASTRPG